VVEEEDHRPPCGLDAAVPSGGRALVRLTEGAQRERWPKGAEPFGGPVSGAVVDDNDVEGSGRHGLLRQGSQAAGQELAAVVGRDDNGRRGLRLQLAHRPAHGTGGREIVLLVTTVTAV